MKRCSNRSLSQPVTIKWIIWDTCMKTRFGLGLVGLLLVGANAMASELNNQIEPGVTESADIVLPVTDANIQKGLSPYNWVSESEYLLTTVNGASITVKFSGTRKVIMQVDLDQVRTAGNPNVDYPVIAWSVNGGDWKSHQLHADEKVVTLAADVVDPVIDLYVKGMSPMGNRFQGHVPANSLKITGFRVDRGCATTPVEFPAKVWLNIGDSIMSGDGAAYATGQGRPKDNAWAASCDGRASYGYLLAKHYGYRESRIAYGGYRWAGGSVPKLSELIDQQTSKRSRLQDGKLVPAPDVVLINLGENSAPTDEVVIESLNKLRSRVTASTKIVVMIPVSGKARVEVSRAVDTYKSSAHDNMVFLIDLGLWLNYSTCDGQHPDAKGHEIIFTAALPCFDALFSGHELPRPIPPQTHSLYWRAPAGNEALEEPFSGVNLSMPASITVYRPAKANGTAVVICPGGAYAGVGMQGAEGTLMAKWFNGLGVTAVVLHYRLPNGRNNLPMLDVQRAIRLVRSKAAEWGCDTRRVGVAGFSAGGHVAATAATHFDHGNPQAVDPVDRLGCRPDFALLIYPVITMGIKTHHSSKLQLLGPSPSEDVVKYFSNELQVSEHTPPCFLAHARDDVHVPPENSRMFYAALQEHGVSAHYLELPSGGHGLNGYQGPMWEAWLAESIQWMVEHDLISAKR